MCMNSRKFKKLSETAGVLAQVLIEFETELLIEISVALCKPLQHTNPHASMSCQVVCSVVVKNPQNLLEYRSSKTNAVRDILLYFA